MSKILTETKCVWLYFPPEEVFVNPKNLFIGYQMVQTVRFEKWKMELPDEGGMFFIEDGKEPFPGIICPVIVTEVASVKRLLSYKLRRIRQNPLLLLFWREALRELDESATIRLNHYYLKPERYSHAVRELYRVLDVILDADKSEVYGSNIIHTVCLFFEFDTYYRFVSQAFLGNMVATEAKRHALRANPRRAILDELRAAEKEATEKTRPTWRALRLAFSVAWYASRTMRCLVRAFVNEVDFSKIILDQKDLYWQFR